MCFIFVNIHLVIYNTFYFPLISSAKYIIIIIVNIDMRVNMTTYNKEQHPQTQRVFLDY